jgi:hypothetical protein
VLPDMKTGNFRTKAQGGGEVLIGSFDKKVETIDGQTLKVFDIFENTLSMSGDYQLGTLEDGTAVVYDARRFAYGLVMRGTIAACLKHIRGNLWYEGGPRHEDEDGCYC